MVLISLLTFVVLISLISDIYSLNYNISPVGYSKYFLSTTMMSKNVELWLQNDDFETNQNKLHDFLQRGYAVDCILTSNLSVDRNLVARNLKIRNNKLYDGSKAVGAIVPIDSDANDQSTALSLVGSVEWIVLNCTGSWTMIPVENLIASCEGTGTKLAIIVNEVDKLPGVIFALQIGVDAVVLSSEASLWEKASEYALQRATMSSWDPTVKSKLHDTEKDSTAQLSKVTITELKTGGVGDRVCVDLIQLLREGDAMLIGSSSKTMALIHAETFSSDFVPARPFRVNAGPVHSYVQLADGSTKYLCELIPGDVVRVVRVDDVVGRAITVGRCKIEARPMILIHFRSESEPAVQGQIFLQQAETVRLLCPVDITSIPETHSMVETCGGISRQGGYRTLPVTEAKVGDKIFVRVSGQGTHVGKRISAQVTEK